MDKDEPPFSRKPYLFILRTDVEKSQIVFSGQVQGGLASEFRLRPCKPDIDHLPADAVVSGRSFIFWKLLFGKDSVEWRKKSDHL